MNAPEEINTERLKLRRYKLEDAVDIFKCYAQDEDVTRFLTWRPHKSIEDTKTFVNNRIDAWNQGNDFTWALITEGILIGGIGLRVKGFKSDFGYVVGRAFWGNGYATEALRSIIKWAFQQPQLFRIGAVCDIDNIASARVMEKCGLEKEGVLRKYIIHPQMSESPRDCYSYSVTK